MGDEPTRREDWRPPAWSRRHQTLDSVKTANARVVLVVDDDESFRVSTAEVLRVAGYTVIQASDGVDALRMLSTMRFDALVLDLKLPNMDGVALLSGLPNPPPVVLASAYPLDPQSRRRFNRSITAYLRKPISPERLLDAVTAAVQHAVKNP
jgi:CheY-like chemotaxis protein